MIKFLNITKKFKNNFWEKSNFALNDVSFEIKSGDLVGFLGANGAGKTTLIKILMDFSRADSGRLEFSPKLGTTPEIIKSHMGYLPERAYLYPHLTGREFLNYVGLISTIPKSDLPQLINKWSEKLQISYALDRPIRGYSKGMQQRLGFISSVIHGPKFLVLDEPLSGMDPLGRRELKSIMKELNNSGVTVFFSSHIVSDVEEICNKVVFIEKGKLIYEGSVDELVMKNSNDLYVVKYLEDNKIETVHVNESEKNRLLKKLVLENKTIIEIEKEKPSLEEIIYKIKN
jgi:ABC-2 type transport system ATP-binding protein